MSTSTARADAAGFPGRSGEVFEGQAERLARAVVEAHERLAAQFTHRVLDLPPAPWPMLPGRDRALLTEMFRQLIIEGRVEPGRVYG